MDNKLHILIGPDEGKSIDLVSCNSFIIGRSSLCDIQMNDTTVSRYHLAIYRKDQKYYIADLGSKNGTSICGREIEPGVEVELTKGVPIVIGMTIIGLGEVCKLLLKPFFNSVGIYSENLSKKFCRVSAVKRSLEFIYNMNNILAESHDINEITEKMMDSIFNLLRRIDRCIIITIDDKIGNFFGIKYRSRRHVDEQVKAYNRYFVEKALSLNQPIMVSDSNNDASEKEHTIAESFKSMKIKSAMCVPISSCFQTYGAIYIDSLEKTNSFRTTDLALLRDISCRAAYSMYNISLSLLDN